MKRIYLDSTATMILPNTPTEIIIKKQTGNPSSIHEEGRNMRERIDQARESLHKTLALQEDQQIIFNSGATEGLFTSIVGCYLARENKKKKILISPFIHSAARSGIKFLEKYFNTEIEELPKEKTGISWENKNWQDYDIIVGESGNAEIGQKYNLNTIKKEKTAKDFPIIINDISASIASTTPKDLAQETADILIFSGEKIGSISGIGIMIHKKNIPQETLLKGSQELGFRGGTENVIGIENLAHSAEQFFTQEQKKFQENCKQFQKLLQTICKKKYAKEILTPEEKNIPHIFSFLLKKGKGKDFAVFADNHGIAVSPGPACASLVEKPSQTLLNLGYSKKNALSFVRISFLPETKKEDLEKLFNVLELFLKKM